MPDLRGGTAHLERAIPLDALNEDLYCQAMRAYAALNDRTNLSRLYSDLKLILQNELDTTPLPETTQLYREMMEVV